MFIKLIGNSFITLLVYVDDIVIASNDPKKVDTLKFFLIVVLSLKIWDN